MHARILAVAVIPLAAVALGGSPATRVYRDAEFGFVVTYPKTFQAARFRYFNRATVEGTAFGDVPHLKWYARYPQPRLPADGVVVLVVHAAGGPPPLLPVSGHDSKLPLARASFRPDLGPRSLFALFVRNGWNMSIRLRFGEHASQADRDSVWKMVQSLHMRPLRTGETTGDASYLVADQATSYPIDSVTKIGAAFLVHAPHGFYALAQQSPDCELTVSLPVAFSCPDGRRWDRMGRPLWSGASQNDALFFAPTDVAGDGHVLVSEHVRLSANTDEIESQLWG